jgi:uncharacterized protein (DUF433 family)
MTESEMTFDEIISDYPELVKEDIIASLSYAKLLASGRVLQSVA